MNSDIPAPTASIFPSGDSSGNNKDSLPPPHQQSAPSQTSNSPITTSTISPENRKSLRAFRVLSIVAAAAAIGSLSSLGIVLRPFFQWDSNRTGAEKNARLKLENLEALAVKRESDLQKLTQSQLSSFSNTLASSQKRLSDTESTIARANDRLLKISQQTEEAESVLASKREEIAATDPILAECRAKISKAQNDLAKLESTLEDTRRMGELLLVSNTMSTVSIAHLEEKKADIQAQLIELKSQYDFLELMASNTTSRLETLENRLAAERDNLVATSRKREEADAQLKEVEQSVARLKQSQQEIEATIAEEQHTLQSVTSEISSKQNERAVADDQLANIRERFGYYRGRLQSLTNQISLSEISLQKLDTSIQDGKAALASLEAKRDLLANDNRDLIKAKEELKKVQDDKATVLAEVAQLRSRVKAIQDEYDSAQRNASNAQSQAEIQRNETAAIEHKLIQLNTQSRNLEREIEAKRSVSALLDADIATKKGTIATLDAEILAKRESISTIVNAGNSPDLGAASNTVSRESEE